MQPASVIFGHAIVHIEDNFFSLRIQLTWAVSALDSPSQLVSTHSYELGFDESVSVELRESLGAANELRRPETLDQDHWGTVWQSESD